MSNLFNKNIRSKLKEASYPFEDAAWHKMELLLDGKEQKRPLFWWIGGSMFLIALLVSGAVWFNNYPTKKSVLSNNNLQSNIPDKNEQIAYSQSSAEKSNAEPNPNKVDEKTSLNNISVLQKSKKLSQNSADVSAPLSSFIYDETSFYLAAFGADLIDIEMEQSDITTIDNDGYLKKEVAGNKIAYQIGVHSFVGASGVFNQNQRSIHQSVQPSFAVGISNDVVLHKKWILSTSVMYAKTFFRIVNPYSLSVPLEYYDNSSHLIQIPVGVRFYPVAAKRIKFYITAGIINNLQIKETMQFYAKEPNQPIPAIEIPINSSSGAEELADFNAGNSNNRLFSSTDEVAHMYSVNQSSRFYMQLYTGIGVDIVAGKKVHFFAQPGFNYDLHKVGTQNKRVYQLGANTGLRWRF
jgi:hypothetical protein